MHGVSLYSGIGDGRGAAELQGKSMYLHFSFRDGPAAGPDGVRGSNEPAWHGNSLRLSIHDLACPTCLAPAQPGRSSRPEPGGGCPTCGRTSTEWHQLTEIGHLLDELCAFARLEAALA